jgi:hypothetical protein
MKYQTLHSVEKQYKGKGNKEILRFQTWKMGNEEITCKIDGSAT